MPKEVAIVERLSRTLHDVHEHAERRFRDDVQTYRSGVQAMASAGGSLPEADAEKLLAATQSLGISPDRMVDDSTVFMSIANIQKRIDAIDARNAERQAPLPQLQSNYNEARTIWGKVKSECDQRLAAAQSAVTDAERALAKVANQRDERADDERQQIQQLRDRNPHLFATLTSDEMRRYLAPSQPIRLL